MSQMDARWTKRWKYDRDRGITRYVDPAPVVAHLRALEAAGASRGSIAVAAGLTKSPISSILNGQKNVRRTTAAAILAVTMDDIRTRHQPLGFVPAVGARRRIQALMAIGYRHADLKAAGVPNSPVTLHQVGEWVTKATYDAIVTVYDRLSMTPGPSAWAVDRARRNGYAPPLAWDDETIDDPAATPDFGAPISTVGGKKFHLEDLQFLADEGLTLPQAAERLAVTRSAIEHGCNRAGRQDLLHQLATNKTRQEAA